MKTYWISYSGACTEYSVPPRLEEAKKFLYWHKEGILVVGAQDNHEQLFKYAKMHVELPNRKADGAGDMSGSDFISGWSSFHLDIDTPRELRSVIKQALGANSR